MGWIGIATGHELTVEGTRRPVFACRTAAGRVPAKVPANVRKDPAAVRLAALCDRLGEHARAVRDRVESWMVRSLPVPAAVFAAVWDDPVWRETLTDLVVAPIVDGAPDLRRCALLREGAWTGADAFAIPHPLLLGDELPVWRERNLTQVVEQVRREVWTRPASMDRTFGVVDTFAYLDARYESGGAFERRVHELGGRIKGDRARFTVHAPEPLGIEIDLDWSGPMSPAYMEGMSFTAGGREIGDIAWSEGVRILMALYDGRTVDEAEPVMEAAEAYSHYCDAHQGEPGTVAPSGLTDPTRDVLLRAGAVLPGPPAGPDEDMCVAVRYEHSVLDEPVVELVRRAAVDGDKAEKSLYDLDPVAETGVGTVHAGPLGFLASALHRYPAHRARILAAHTDLRAAGGLAARKPGLARAVRLLADRLPKGHPAHTTAAARLGDLREHVTGPDTTLPLATGVTSVAVLERAAGATAAHLPESRLAIGEALILEPAGDGYRVHLRPSRWSDLDALAPALRRGGATEVALVMEDLRFLRSSGRP